MYASFYACLCVGCNEARIFVCVVFIDIYEYFLCAVCLLIGTARLVIFVCGVFIDIYERLVYLCVLCLLIGTARLVSCVYFVS